MSFSAFHVVARGGASSVERFRAGADIVGGAADVPGARTVESFRRIVSAVRGVAPVVPEGAAQAAAAPDTAPSGPVFDNFTLLGSGMRWRQADLNTAVLWYRNSDRPSPLTSGSIDTEITTALAAWTNPTTASLTMTYGGTRSAGGTGVTDVYCISANSGAGLISFEDPENNISSGVLAVGGGCSSGPIHTVSGQSFSSFSNGFVVFNDAAQLSASYKVAPSFTRVLTHEIGHGIGLGHTTTQTDLMYPSCCYGTMPLPPAIGPDDLAGLNYIYPASSQPDPPACTYSISPTTVSYPWGGGSSSVAVTASASTCAWTATSNVSWASITSGASGTGTGSVSYGVAANSGAARSGTMTIAGQTLSIAQDAQSDSDNDGLPDWWETALGLSPGSSTGNDGAAGDPDGDGRSNLDEYNARTHPRGFATRYLAEGAVNAFFATEIALLNPSATPAVTLVRIQPQGEAERSTYFTIPARTRRTLTASDLSGLAAGSFSTVIESDGALVIDRTMSWDATGYGAHAETALAAPSTTWYLAEGATAGDFSLFYLLQNPNATPTTASVRFLRPSPLAPVVLSYTLPPNSRTTIPVDTAAPELAATDVSGVITSTLPIIVERAMYLSRPNEPFSAGHESAGVTAPSETWFLAEGATGPFFELFVLIANPNSTTSNVAIDYLLPDGTTLTKDYTVGANSRYTIWVDEEQFPTGSGNKALQTASVSMRVRSTNAVPIIVERSMWWPQGAWYEAHNSPGTTVTGTRWGLAGGESGGANTWQTYVLIANTSSFAGQAQVTAYFEDSTTATTTVSLPALSRTNVAMSSVFPTTSNRRFSIVVQSVGSPTAPQIVVERAMYSNANGVVWSAGTAAVATRLAP
jgi:hypothetical protein